jgi:hypothetical protein
MTPATLDHDEAGLTPVSAEDDTDSGPARNDRDRQRKCIVRQERHVRDEMVRFVLSPEAEVVPDLACRLPGRGAWVFASRSALDLAQTKGAFARAFRRPVRLPSGLTSIVADLLARRALDLLGMAKKAGDLVVGFEKVRESVRTERPLCLIEAADGSDDGRGKLLALMKAVHADDKRDAGTVERLRLPPVVGCFSAAELGMALGRERVIHACLKDGRVSRIWMRELGRVAGFRSLTPDDWRKAGGLVHDRDPATEGGTAS